MARVSINTDEVSNVVSQLNLSCDLLESELSGKITKTFSVLSNLGLASKCVNKLESQVDSIVSLTKSVIESISSHISDVLENERGLNSDFNRGYSSGGYSGGDYQETTGGSDDGVAPAGSEIAPDEEDDGKQINVEAFSQIINTLNNTEKENLLKLVKINKEEKTDYVDLFLDTKYSEELFKVLKKILGNTVDFNNFTAEDINLVQKIMLNSIFNSEVHIEELENNSIIMAKEYLIDICKDYNISASDLIFDDNYRNVLKQSIKNLYMGLVKNNYNDELINKVRDYVDSIALKNNIQAEELLDNKFELLL